MLVTNSIITKVDLGIAAIEEETFPNLRNLNVSVVDGIDREPVWDGVGCVVFGVPEYKSVSVVPKHFEDDHT